MKERQSDVKFKIRIAWVHESLEAKACVPSPPGYAPQSEDT